MSEKFKFTVGQIVYSQINAEVKGMITGILIRPQHVVYLVNWSDESTEREHYAIEITTDKSFESGD